MQKKGNEEIVEAEMQFEMRRENLFYNENCLKVAVTSEEDKDQPSQPGAE